MAIGWNTPTSRAERFMVAQDNAKAEGAATREQQMGIAQLSNDTALEVAKINAAAKQPPIVMPSVQPMLGTTAPKPGIAALGSPAVTPYTGSTQSTQSVTTGMPPNPYQIQPNMASGGIVKGKGTTTSDSVPVNLSKGEAVLPAKTVKALGGKSMVERLIEMTNGKPPVKGGIQAGGNYSTGGVGRHGNLPAIDDNADKPILAGPVGRKITDFLQSAAETPYAARRLQNIASMGPEDALKVAPEGVQPAAQPVAQSVAQPANAPSQAAQSQPTTAPVQQEGGGAGGQAQVPQPAAQQVQNAVIADSRQARNYSPKVSDETIMATYHNKAGAGREYIDPETGKGSGIVIQPGGKGVSKTFTSINQLSPEQQAEEAQRIANIIPNLQRQLQNSQIMRLMDTANNPEFNPQARAAARQQLGDLGMAQQSAARDRQASAAEMQAQSGAEMAREKLGIDKGLAEETIRKSKDPQSRIADLAKMAEVYVKQGAELNATDADKEAARQGLANISKATNALLGQQGGAAQKALPALEDYAKAYLIQRPGTDMKKIKADYEELNRRRTAGAK